MPGPKFLSEPFSYAGNNIVTGTFGHPLTVADLWKYKIYPAGMAKGDSIEAHVDMASSSMKLYFGKCVVSVSEYDMVRVHPAMLPALLLESCRKVFVVEVDCWHFRRTSLTWFARKARAEVVAERERLTAREKSLESWAGFNDFKYSAWP